MRREMLLMRRADDYWVKSPIRSESANSCATIASLSRITILLAKKKRFIDITDRATPPLAPETPFRRLAVTSRPSDEHPAVYSQER